MMRLKKALSRTHNIVSILSMMPQKNLQWMQNFVDLIAKVVQSEKLHF